MIEILQTGSPKILGFKLSGKLHDDDYKTFVPLLEAGISAVGGKVRLLAIFEDFHGWDVHAAWDDFKFGVKHYNDFERIALVGDKKWEEWMAFFCKPFTSAAVNFYYSNESDAALAWLKEGAEADSK